MADRPDNSNDETRRYWDSIYQQPLEQIPWEAGAPSAELVELIESSVVEKGPALDICCGTGNNASYLAKQGFACYGIDISPTAIDLARKKAAREGVNCQLIEGNASRLPYPDSAFTLVFDRGCFHSMSPEDRAAFISGLHRVLRPGGKYKLSCFSKKDHADTGLPHSFSPQDIRHYFSRLFRIHYIREVTRHGNRFLSVLMEKRQDY